MQSPFGAKTQQTDIQDWRRQVLGVTGGMGVRGTKLCYKTCVSQEKKVEKGRVRNMKNRELVK